MMRALQYRKAFPPRTLDGKRICREPTCSNVLTGRSRSFCSTACRDRVLILCWPSEQRRQTFQRDHGICASCGLDCEAAWATILAHTQTVHDGERYRDFNGTMCLIARREPLTVIGEWLGVRLGNRKTFWEANHRVPVIEGGTSDLDNLETLCLICHKAHSADLAQRRARARRQQIEP